MEGCTTTDRDSECFTFLHIIKRYSVLGGLNPFRAEGELTVFVPCPPSQHNRDSRPNMPYFVFCSSVQTSEVSPEWIPVKPKLWLVAVGGLASAQNRLCTTSWMERPIQTPLKVQS